MIKKNLSNLSKTPCSAPNKENQSTHHKTTTTHKRSPYHPSAKNDEHIVSEFTAE